MKYIHFPTLALHGLLLILARLLLNDSHDGFLVAAGLLLAGHVIWSCCSRRSLLPSHLIGCAVQAAFFGLGIIEVSRGPFGLGGGEFGLFFYLIALGISAVLEAFIGIIRYYRKK